ncbi:hypothetical protein [Halococcus saccharolyticus]|uniref:PRC-barrel domain-containing protein n=1 Tax=Halococcus saccharolyticus DSM 5350 TaxID=1227455 RepID=M0MQF9_9EURY|nr:hypothetical protein [Halococcus saccharolyticus]EMA46715.1 hypothetical protein C449_03576 [Halococcus saccharolyticus DSM 5350]
MARDLTDDDRGKSVVDHEGNRIGSVTDTENGKGIIETNDDSSLTDKLKSALSWDDSDDSHELQNDHVDSVNDDEVRLRNL